MVFNHNHQVILTFFNQFITTFKFIIQSFVLQKLPLNLDHHEDIIDRQQWSSNTFMVDQSYRNSLLYIHDFEEADPICIHSFPKTNLLASYTNRFHISWLTVEIPNMSSFSCCKGSIFPKKSKKFKKCKEGMP